MTTTSTPTPTAAQLKADGNTQFAAKNYPAAAQLFTQAIAADPSQHVLYSNRSACHAAMKEYAEALEDAQECVRLAPTWAKGYVRWGAALFGLGKHQEAMNAYKQGLEHEPGNDMLQRGLNEVESAAAAASSAGPARDFGLGMLLFAALVIQLHALTLHSHQTTIRENV
jgi:stress-induced-phosphoprotein 1